MVIRIHMDKYIATSGPVKKNIYFISQRLHNYLNIKWLHYPHYNLADLPFFVDFSGRSSRLKSTLTLKIRLFNGGVSEKRTALFSGPTHA